MEDSIIKKIVQIGNGLAVLIPRKILKEKNLKLGDHVRINIISKVKITIKDVKENQKKLGVVK